MKTPKFYIQHSTITKAKQVELDIKYLMQYLKDKTILKKLGLK